MLCRKQLENLVPDISSSISSIIIEHVDHEYYLSLLGARLRRDILRSRIRRLQDVTEVPLLSYESPEDDLD
jgi:hypothetical protein